MNTIEEYLKENLLDQEDIISNATQKASYVAWVNDIVDRYEDQKPNCDCMQNPLHPGDIVLYMPVGSTKGHLEIGMVLRTTPKIVFVSPETTMGEHLRAAKEYESGNSSKYEYRVAGDRCIKISKEQLY